MNARLLRACLLAGALTTAAGGTWALWRNQPGPWSARHLTAARALAAQHDFVAARATLRTLLLRLPLEREARWQLVELELAQRRPEQAYLELKAHTELFPDDAEAWLLVAQLMSGGGLLEEAEAAASNALDAAPEHRQARALRAQLRLRRGRFHGAGVDARAIDDAMLALRAQEMLRDARVGRAPDPARIRRGARRERGEFIESHVMVWPGTLAELRSAADQRIRASDWAGAAAVAAQARTGYPGSVIGPWLDGVIAQSRGDPTAAEAAYAEALRVAPRSALVTKALAQLWAQREGAASAGAKLAQLAERDPGFAFARRHAASAYLSARRPDLAEAALRRGVDAARDAGASRDLAAFYLELDRAGEALAACREGLARFPRDAELRALQARLALRGGDTAAAIATLDTLLQEQPDRNADAVLLAQLIAPDTAQRPRALALLRNVASDAPAELSLVDGVGWGFALAGDTRRAREWLEAAARAAPDDATVREHLQSLGRKAGSPSTSS
ncbi:MAG TPA: tetratricopeptide repeat protein [Verrucomicrobiae bacterium]|nr:tetratricopeptide repeat protein [Verrucomicrobiae bacterium]